MSSERIRHIIGVAILCLAIVASFWRVASRNVHTVASDRIELRVGHQNIHVGMREGFAAAIESYERLHPNVKITQVAVPLRTYPAWLRIQLIGGNAVDILSIWETRTDDIRRYFLPLSPYLDEPNPYNTGTSLEGIPWRDTFFDGLSNVRQSDELDNEIYSISLQRVSTLLFINLDLLREITGSDESLPRDFDDLRSLAAQVQAYNQRTGKRIIPIASGRIYSQIAFSRIVPSLTQKLVLDHSPSRNLRMDGFDRLMLNGTVTYSKTPELKHSLELMCELAQMLTPGFTQFENHDAVATYAQQRSLMIIAGSWDYGTLVASSDFETRAIPIPLPSPSDSKYGDLVLGPSAEIQFPDGTLGIVKSSKHRDVALDFLRHLSSQPVATQFSEMSQRLPSIVDAPISKHLEQLLPDDFGEIPGFRVDLMFAANAQTFIARHIHEVVGLRPDTLKFAERVDAEIAPYIRQDIATQLRNLKREIRSLDSTLALRFTFPEGKPEPRRTWNLYAEQQHQRQYDWQRLAQALTTPQAPEKKNR